MDSTQIDDILQLQRDFYDNGATIPVSFREKQLKKLYQAVQKYRPQIEEALKKDLGKSSYESFMCEIGLVLSEISYMIRHVKKFSKRKTVYTPLAQFASHSYVQPVPYGNTLIMSPWNYPFLLSIDPLVDAIAAGNTAIIKPSAYSPATSKVIEMLVKECFSPAHVSVVTGGRAENAALLEKKFDFIFFTGSQNVGREVMRHAVVNLTPVVLELGGKSPCIVEESADIRLAARRIVFGKYLNCGQTCVAPDFILCHKSIQDKLLQELKLQVEKQFGSDPLADNDYGKIINQKHFDRLCRLLQSGELYLGGETDAEALRIAPAIMTQVTFDDPVMQEEIFGPVLPVLTYENFDELMLLLKKRPKPLAQYLFSSNKAHIRRVNEELSYGGGCINDTIIHLATSEMGFGGVGESGMGAYHGKAGFDAFSHQKSIVDKKTWLDLPMRYQPYTSKLYRKLLQIFLR
ncbi:MAG: aldehyde dehydrogenase [Lachnospiraceae bacterium]|nr:aldehyde dehydrogenase [Lachnospiraceae bacterium]